MFKKNEILKERRVRLLNFQKKVGIKFSNIDLLNQAFTHCSYSNDKSYEKLEFVGDSVLGLVTVDELYSILPKSDEGSLAKIKSVVVSEDALSSIALDFGFEACILLGKGEELSGGRLKKTIMADVVEAVIGAYYLDSGFEKAKKFVLFLISDFLMSVLRDGTWFDYKSLLQVFLQQNYGTTPVYIIDNVAGPDHNKTFWSKVIAADKTYGPSEGKSKKDSEQAVARIAYNDLCGS